MKRFLRRYNLLEMDQEVKRKGDYLRLRQAQQLSLLEPLNAKTNPQLLDLKIQDLVNLKQEEVFNTFAVRCLRPQIQKLQALADINIQRVHNKNAHKCVPFTVKDNIRVQGMIETIGFHQNHTPSTHSADLVELLQKQGCVAFAHSNVPQGILGIQSGNSLYGITRNPYNTDFVSGGSSGGEAALVASKATAFGIGTDSGGSVRIPAAFCGIYALKPTGSKRLSIRGRLGPSGAQSIKVGDLDPSLGFMTRSIDDLQWLCSKTLGKQASNQSPFMYGGQWNKQRYKKAQNKKLKVGYLYELPDMQTAPGLVNTIQETLTKLQQNGHKIYKFQFPLNQFRNYFFRFVHLSGYLNALYTRLQRYPIPHQLIRFYDRKLYGDLGFNLQNFLTNDQSIKQLNSLIGSKQTIGEFLKLSKQAEDLKKSFQKEWNKHNIDILLTPVMPFTAPLVNTTQLLVYQLSFCSFQNLTEQPAGVIPTRLVTKEETKYQANNSLEREIAQGIARSYGLPLALQVTGRHMQDEQCLAAMWEIDRLNGKYTSPKNM